ncbi:2-oxoglutarate and iron-dependent oxygenase domain-containing protein CP2-like [Vigna umbellata]|uniref:2-oxoglutarate and iron-dependent oxygenase domain-containing protein CP2-like n=1 Tax=Vigna umbellata TaxID=87088 RepID=UPI001F5E5864|nr:2-oxoglutarate and iron-dependent oxygenase domain-containing protein CP2-like [Vigna umbellata]
MTSEEAILRTFSEHHFSVAIEQNTEEGFRNIIDEPFPGLHLICLIHNFVKYLIALVDYFLRWADDLKFKTTRPNILHEHGVVLHDLGLEPMLHRFREEYIEPT